MKKPRAGRPAPTEEPFDLAPLAAELRIVSQGSAPLGKDQQTFNRLVKQLNTLRNTLAEWAGFADRHQQQVIKKLAPLQQKFSALRREAILLVASILDGAFGGVTGKRPRATLTTHLIELAGAYLDGAPDDAEIIALHDRHAVMTRAEDEELERQMTREFAAQFMGVELDDDDIGSGSIDEILAAGMAKAREADEQAANQRGSRTRGRKQNERRAQREADAARAAHEVSQSVREVYRKLASALHPDRATDDADRARRHGLMQRANVAYESSDLLGLLTLQLELEQIDAEHLAQVSHTRIQHYNTVLREQLRELERELEQTKHRFTLLLEDPFATVSMPSVEAALRRVIGGARRQIRDLQGHCELLRNPRQRVAWLTYYSRVLREEEREDAQMLREMEAFDAAGSDPFDLEFGDFDPFDGEGIFAPADAPRRKTRPRRLKSRRR